MSDYTKMIHRLSQLHPVKSPSCELGFASLAAYWQTELEWSGRRPLSRVSTEDAAWVYC